MPYVCYGVFQMGTRLTKIANPERVAACHQMRLTLVLGLLCGFGMVQQLFRQLPPGL